MSTSKSKQRKHEGKLISAPIDDSDSAMCFSIDLIDPLPRALDVRLKINISISNCLQHYKINLVNSSKSHRLFWSLFFQMIVFIQYKYSFMLPLVTFR